MENKRRGRSGAISRMFDTIGRRQHDGDMAELDPGDHSAHNASDQAFPGTINSA